MFNFKALACGFGCVEIQGFIDGKVVILGYLKVHSRDVWSATRLVDDIAFSVEFGLSRNDAAKVATVWSYPENGVAVSFAEAGERALIGFLREFENDFCIAGMDG